jgi:hypothetical protein
MLARQVTLGDGHDQQSEKQVTKIVADALDPAVVALDEFPAEIAEMVGADPPALHYREDGKLVSGVVTRVQRRCVDVLRGALPLAAAQAGEGVGTLAWAHRLLNVPNDLEVLVAALQPVVPAEDMKHQFKDVFTKDESIAEKLKPARFARWCLGKQSQIDGLVAELRIASAIKDRELGADESLFFGRQFSAPLPSTEGEDAKQPSSSKSRRPPQELRVKADLSYKDRSGKLWFAEVAEGVEGLRKKVTRLDAHQRHAYQRVAQTQNAGLKYVCSNSDGWMKLCKRDKKEPAPVSVMADGGWILQIGAETLTNEQLARAAHNGGLLYGNYRAETVGKRREVGGPLYLSAWRSLTEFAQDPNPVSTFLSKTSKQPDLVKST